MMLSGTMTPNDTCHGGEQESRSTHECHGSLGLVCRTVFVRNQGHLPHYRELQFGIVHLDDMVTPALRRLDDRGVDNLNRTWICLMFACHILIHLAHCAIQCDITELLVHVVRVCATLVPQPDGIVLHLHGALLEDFIHSQQLTTTSLGLVEPLHEIPETGLCQNFVFREETHAVDLWTRPFHCWCCSADDLVLVHLLRQGRVQLELHLRVLHHACRRHASLAFYGKR